MPTTQDLCTWLRHNIEDLRLGPDMVTEAAGPTVRVRWHGIVSMGGSVLGLGVDLRADLRDGPELGEIWLYGHGARELRIPPDDTTLLPAQIRARLRCILLAHIRDRDDESRGHRLLHQPRRVDAVA